MKIGDIVVCVNDIFNPDIAKCFQQLPIKDRKYTIRAVRPPGAESGILLNELKNKSIFFKLYQGNLEPAFSQKRFLIIDPIKSIERVEEDELIHV